MSHPTSMVLIGEKDIEVDTKLAPAIRKLNNLGIQTKFSCQGGTTGAYISTAYLVVDDDSIFPKELLEIWTYLGFTFRNNSKSVYAYPKFSGTASESFCLILSDWAEDTLRNKEIYRVSRLAYAEMFFHQVIGKVSDLFR